MIVELNGRPAELPDGRDGRRRGRAEAGAERREPRRRGGGGWRGGSPGGVGETKLESDQTRGGGTGGPGWIATGGDSAAAASARTRRRRWFELGGRTWGSRLIVGTGGFRSLEAMERALVGLRGRDRHGRAAAGGPARARFGARGDRRAWALFALPNTAGCYTARDAVRTAQLAREAFETDWIKLEVIGDDRTLFPDAVELVDAAEKLVDEGFTVLPYTNDDPILARRLEDAGARR